MYIGYLDFPRKIQMTDYTCGPCSVYCITQHFGKKISYGKVKRKLKCDEDGTSEKNVVKFFRKRGFRVSIRPKMDFDDLIEALSLRYVALVSLDTDHYGVIYGYDYDSDEFMISDPSIVRWQTRKISSRKFMKRWDDEAVLVRPKNF